MSRNEPLGLPRGSVRAILTFALVTLTGVLLFVPAADKGAREAVLVLTGIAVRDYFEVRKRQNEESGPPLDPPAPFED